MTMKTFFSIIAILLTAVVIAIFVAGYISKSNREKQAAYVSTIQQEVTKMTETMTEASTEIERLRLENEKLEAELSEKESGGKGTKKTTVTPVKTTQVVPPKPVTPTTPAPPVQPKPTLTQAVVSKHATEADCWITVSGKVYSVSSYIAMHPGGRTAILNQCGKDATTAFTTRGGTGAHSSSAWSTLGTFFVGAIGSPLSI